MFIRVCLCLLLGGGQSAPILPDQNPLELNAEIRQFLEAKVDREALPMQRLQALVSTVFLDKEIAFTYSAETRTAIETFTNRNGNCLSFTILFVAMARQVGLDARFREVEVAPTWSKNGIFVNLNQHVNAAVFIDGLPYAVDVFPEVNRIELGGRVVNDARGLAHFYNNRGVDALGGGDLEEGIAYLKKALEVDPQMVPAWINLGAAESKRGQLSEAEGHYRTALKLDSRNPTAMANLAIVCDLTGRHQEAERYQAKVKAFREKNPYHQYNLGLQAFDEGRYEDAIAFYKKAIKLKAPEHNFHFALAKAYGKVGRLDAMADCLRKAMKYATDDANRLRYSQKLELLKSARLHAAPAAAR